MLILWCKVGAFCLIGCIFMNCKFNFYNFFESLLFKSSLANLYNPFLKNVENN